MHTKLFYQELKDIVQSAAGKRWRLYILPQYFENLTQPKRHRESRGLYENIILSVY